MKINRALLLLALVLPLVGAADPSPVSVSVDIPTDPSRGSHETVEMKVLKVFSAKDGDAIFRAYLVSWKDQEVIASDTLAMSDYKVGDTVRVLVMSHPFPQNKEPHGLLAFQVTPQRR